MPPSAEIQLTAIVPLTRMSGRLGNLDNWLSKSKNLPIRVVIVHDIQDLATGIELKELLLKHEHVEIQLIEGAFGSPGLARNRGLQTQRATWTAFWDADDLPNPASVFEGIAEATSETEVVIGNFTINSPDGKSTNKHHKKIEVVALNPGLWRMAIRSSILNHVSFSASRMGEDQLFLVDLNLGTRNIHYSNLVFYEYFQGSPLQLTAQQDTINEVEETLGLVTKRLSQNKRLRDTFSEIVILRLASTTIFRSTQKFKLRSILRAAPILLRTNRITIAKFVAASSKKLLHKS